MIIGLGGRKRSGKSTVADYIIKTRGAKQYAFADGVRSLALSWYRHIIPDESYLRENKDKPLSDQFNEFPYSQCYLFSSVDWAPMKRQDGGHELVARGYIYNTSAGRDLHTILQSGVPVDVSSRGFGSTQAGTWRGKSAQIVQNFICLSVPYWDNLDKNKRGVRTGRDLLKAIEDFGRDVCPDIWTQILFDQLDEETEPTDLIVIDDVRMPDERARIRESGGLLVLLRRGDDEAVDGHWSENSFGTTDEYDAVFTAPDGGCAVLEEMAEHFLTEHGL